jgi:Flp pilus assembly protein TadD
MPPLRWKITACVFLIVITGVTYAGLVNNDFIWLDDNIYLLTAEQVQQGLTLKGLTWAFTTTYASNWHPLTWLSHMLDCQLFGLNPGPHHLVNLLFHVANTLLLFLFLLKTTGARWPSLAVAALFALHPLHVESVAWASERKDVLSAFFWMLTMLAYARYAARPAPARYLLILLCFTLGLMAKPMLVTLPLVLLLLDYWPLGRLSLPEAKGKRGPGKEPGVPLKSLILEKIPLLVLAALSSLVTIYAQKEAIVENPLAALPVSARLANAVVAYVTYISKAVWPSSLALLYPQKAIPGWQFLGAALILITSTILIIRQSRGRPYLPVGWLWFLGTLVPVIGLVQVGPQALADRYSYLPFIGLFIMAAWGLAELLERRRLPRYLVAAAAGIILAALMTCTWLQLRLWRDSVTLFEHTLKIAPNNPVIHHNLGLFFGRSGQNDRAITHFQEAVRLWPNFAIAHNSLGFALAISGKTDQALPHYEKALRLRPGYAKAHKNLGLALASRGQTAQALAHFKEYSRLEPDSALGYYTLGAALEELGEEAEAIRQYQAALRLQPDYIKALNNLSFILAAAADPKLRDSANAVRLAEKAHRLCRDPFPDLLDTLAAAYAAAGRFAVALETSQKALEMARSDGNQDLAQKIEKRIKLYRAGRAFHK